MPLSAGRSWKKASSASRPPAEQPMPTMGKSLALGASGGCGAGEDYFAVAGFLAAVEVAGEDLGLAMAEEGIGESLWY